VALRGRHRLPCFYRADLHRTRGALLCATRIVRRGQELDTVTLPVRRGAHRRAQRPRPSRAPATLVTNGGPVDSRRLGRDTDQLPMASCGLDFGTSNSALACRRRVLKHRRAQQRAALVPLVLFFPRTSARPSSAPGDRGIPRRQRWALHPVDQRHGSPAAASPARFIRVAPFALEDLVPSCCGASALPARPRRVWRSTSDARPAGGLLRRWRKRRARRGAAENRRRAGRLYPHPLRHRAHPAALAYEATWRATSWCLVARLRRRTWT